jgi:TrmH family RNA methyltransferase
VKKDYSRYLSDSVKIVLMRTTHPGNIGAVARAMKNMGLNRLCLVNPSDCTLKLDEARADAIPTESHEAVRRAAGAEDVLAGAEIFSSVDDALAGVHVVIGASARSRKMTWPLMNPRDCAELIIEHTIKHQLADNSQGEVKQVAVLFGQEASGLSNEELQRCHYHVNIPAVAEFSSLNLAMAVQLVCYEIRMAMLLDSSIISPVDQVSPVLSAKDDGWDEGIAPVEEVEGFFKHLEETLIAIDFHDPENPRQLMTRLRRLFQRAHMDKMEVNIFRGILSAAQKVVRK